MADAPRIVLTTVGSFGDLHPFISVGLALKARGCDTVIATAENYRSKVEKEGLGFHPVRPTLEQIQKGAALTGRELWRKVAVGGAGFFIEKAIAPYIAESYVDLYEILSSADLAVISGFSIGARMASAKMCIPYVSLLIYPCSIVSADDPPYMVEFPWLPIIRRTLGRRAVNFVLRLLVAKLRWHSRKITQFRRQLGLRPAHFDDVFGESLYADWVVAAYSPCLGPPPPGLGDIAGFTFYDVTKRVNSAGLAKPVADFLKNGPAPLVFTLGSILGTTGDKFFFEEAVKTARLLGMRAILLVGADAEPEFRRLASSDVLVAGYVPYSLVFPQAAAIIHHAGIGTIGLALRAGRPQLVCPYMGDHRDNAERLVRLGAAKRLNLNRFTAKRATAALRFLLGDGPKNRAAELGPQVARENGAAVIADRILTMLGQRTRMNDCGSAASLKTSCSTSN